MRTIEYSVDLCVVGGGIAGLCTAVSAARHGTKVVLMQDRPVLGGNSSSEIRMWICGCHGDNNRETGIVEEIQLENFYQNRGLKFSLWDSVLYEIAMSEPNLTLLLNTTCLEASTLNNQINSVKGWQLNSETYYIVKAKFFADCSGDSILAPLTGAKYMYGREAKSEFGERIPPDAADKKTMGMSCLFQIRETDSKKEFIPPKWAYKYPKESDLPYKSHALDTNFWWIELGGDGDALHDVDKNRHELLKIAYGVWDHIKNYGDHGADNWELEWIGFLPGKRESRRYIGEYIINQNDVESEGRFDDIVAYAGWTMDDHFPEGFNYVAGYPTIFHPAPTPWGICFRSLYSENIDNLLFAGRNISVTHAALSSSRVMATCGVIGQAVGTAVSIMIKDNTTPRTVNIKKLQKTLMDDDCYLPWQTRQVSKLTQSAACSADVVRNGIDRGDANCYIGKSGDCIEYTFAKPEKITSVRLVFDSLLNREYHNMPCRFLLKEPAYKLPDTLIKKYKILFTNKDGKEQLIEINDNHQRFVTHRVDFDAVSVKLIPEETWGGDTFRVFDFELA